MPPTIPARLLEKVSIAAYRIPTITAYNRLEASPRSADFARSLRAEVRDPLWMLTRQWQLGEFQGEDAASPVTALIVGEHTAIDHVAFPGRDPVPLDVNLPLETQVERERLFGNLFLATQMARVFMRSLRERGLLGVYRGKLLDRYPLQYAIDRNDVEGAQLFAAVNGELCDGFKVHADIATPRPGGGTVFDAWMDSEGIPAPDQQLFRDAAAEFEAWFRRGYSQPADTEKAWMPSRLEYQFAVGSSQERTRLTADQYSEGHLDWYSFDVDRSASRREPSGPPPVGVTENPVSFIPSPVAFKGMPNPRFWMMEENQTDFGALDTSATGLLHLLFAEFGLVYGNDWFLLPYPIDINTLCEIRGMTVTDVFGQHTLVRPAGRGKEDEWQRWVMFHHTDVQTSGASSFHYVAPALTKALEGDPLEKVNLLRDEMANLVWAVESIVPSQSGRGVSGNELALKEKRASPFAPVNENVLIRYVAGTTVPDNWIPFIPVRMDGSVREIRLQRARMPGTKGALGVLLSENPAPYYVNEEEIPRAGISVQRSFQRARWLDGRTFLWIGRYKEAGKGEGWSNLQFDQIVDIPQNQR